MADYLVIKREKCPACEDDLPGGCGAHCPGYIDTQVPLVEALRETLPDVLEGAELQLERTSR